jgi:hypothetical protein
MQLTCRCDHQFEVDLPTNHKLNLEDLYKALQEGTFLSVKCPDCKITFMPDMEYEVWISDLDLRFEVRSYIDRHLSEIQNGLRNENSHRLVFGCDELKEKICLLHDKLDDVIIERIKGTFYHTNPQDYQLEYLDRNESSLRFAVRDIYHNVVGHTRFPLASYQELQSSTNIQEELQQYYLGYVNALEKKNA